jgi:hypothetical protein
MECRSIEEIKVLQEQIQILNMRLDSARKRYDWMAYENIFAEKIDKALELRRLQGNLNRNLS